MKATLLCRTGELSGRTHQLANETVIGRAGSADVVVQSHLISARHARIVRRDQAFVLEDLGSTNGTWLDGSRVVEPVTLDRLNVISFAGAFDFIFVVVEGTGAVPTGVRPTPAPRAADEKPRTELDLEVLGPLPELQDGSVEKPRTVGDLEGLGPLPELRQSGAGPPTELDATPFQLPELQEKGPAGRGAGYRIEVTFGDGRKETFELPKGQLTLGRSPLCDIPLNDPEVSRHHATLTVGDNVILEDAASSNGTHVGGRRIDRATRVEPGASFTLGINVKVTLMR